MTTSDAREKTDYRLERSRIHLLAALNALRAGTLSSKEADRGGSNRGRIDCAPHWALVRPLTGSRLICDTLRNRSGRLFAALEK
jgi:hypothetical protein